MTTGAGGSSARAARATPARSTAAMYSTRVPCPFSIVRDMDSFSPPPRIDPKRLGVITSSDVPRAAIQSHQGSAVQKMCESIAQEHQSAEELRKAAEEFVKSARALSTLCRLRYVASDDR